ncbi:hypothetical protein [Paenibacillus sp. 1001270B_150601_E10]|uniref:hypothetical protein n=1 Tax=Paenibacillus sp. 1001270B_150601_E10 TaxID=2787079 RepID=UPI0018A0ADBC|nr:hypothetical protein [Paenibacillus sp. 1001270B_150601_E10]
MENQFWQLNEFSDLLGRHFTTVNSWFNDLEKNKIHFVNKTQSGNKRVFDSLDLEIGKLIVRLRDDEGYNLEAIRNKIATDPSIETRPFPIDYQSDQQELSIEVVSNEISKNIESQVGNLLKNFEEQMMLRLGESAEERIIRERQRDINNMITTNRIQTKLELEALDKWAELPTKERSIGLFVKREDTIKREMFVKKYILENFESRLNNEMKND